MDQSEVFVTGLVNFVVNVVLLALGIINGSILIADRMYIGVLMIVLALLLAALSTCTSFRQLRRMERMARILNANIIMEERD